MRGPKPTMITLSDAQRQELEHLTRCHSTPQQLALRARIVLAAADGANNYQIKRQVQVSLGTVRRWRSRFLVLQATTLEDLPMIDRLSDAPRPGKPPQITAEQVCQIVALACEAPQDSHRPISQWTAREIAAEIEQRGIVSSISSRHAARLLKSGHSNHI